MQKGDKTLETVFILAEFAMIDLQAGILPRVPGNRTERPAAAR